jgi:hypothetical protein
MYFPINQNFSINAGNRSGRNRSQSLGMVVHETATDNATDENEVKYFTNNVVKASVHGFVDYDSITQTLPWEELCWGAGGTANSRFIQIELCHFDGDLFPQVWIRGIFIFAWVFVNVLGIHTVTKENLMSHKEVSETWHETDHTDPSGFFADNGKTVDEFRECVQAEIDIQLQGGGGSVAEQWKELAVQEAMNQKILTKYHNPLEIPDMGTLSAMMTNSKTAIVTEITDVIKTEIAKAIQGGN